MREFFSTVGTSPSHRDFLSEFLTPTEQMMLAKRLAVIFLLAQGFSIYRIQQILKVSPSTVARIKLQLERGKFKKIVASARSRKHRQRFQEMLDLLLLIMLPQQSGKTRWGTIDKLLAAYDH